MFRYVLAASFLIVLMLPAAAAAKGPTSASISGPGLDHAIVIKGDGEGPGSTLGVVASTSGYFDQAFEQRPDRTLASRPAGTLGPRYTVVYRVPGPSKIRSRLVQYDYPYARPVVLTYMKPGQEFWGDRATHGGWYKASLSLRRVLIRAGLPARAPR